MSATPGQVAYEAWADAHGRPAGFPSWEQMPDIIRPKWEAVARAAASTHETLLRVVARQVEDIHYALGLGSDEDGVPVLPAEPFPVPGIWSGLTAHPAPGGRKCALLLPHQSTDCTSGQPGDGDALVSALGELIEVLADPSLAGGLTRACLRTCRMCRNRLLCLLDTAPYTGDARQQFARRLRALSENHSMFHAEPLARDHGDARTPQIRGISHGQ